MHKVQAVENFHTVTIDSKSSSSRSNDRAIRPAAADRLASHIARNTAPHDPLPNLIQKVHAPSQIRGRLPKSFPNALSHGTGHL
jgi:predicted transcriptional regulator